MTIRPVRVARLLAVGLLAIQLVGCVSLPDSSSVNTGRGAGVHQGLGPIRSSPPGPRPGLPREDIIAGYLRAMLAFPSDPAVVRQYMSPQAAQEWDPDATIQVYQNPTVVPGHNEIHLKASLLGSLDGRGSWTTTTGTAADMDVSVRMVRVSNQWRIAEPVQGTLINTEHFNRYYHQFSLYFFDPTYTLLAPDPVYLEIGTPSATATALVVNLLQGPTADMAGVVRSAAPPPTRLVAPQVSVSSSGVADIPLSTNVEGLDAQHLLSLTTQLAWTLRQERVGVNDLRLVVGGSVLPVQSRFVIPVDSFHDPTINASSDTLYALSRKGRLLRVPTGGDPVEVTGPIGTTEVRARSVAVNPSDTCAAVVSEDGRTVLAGPLTPGSSDTFCQSWHRGGTNLLRPSWDSSGLLWLVDVTDHQARVEVATKRAIRTVDAPGIAGEDVRAFAVSRDGMRLAAVLGRGDKSRLVVAMIKRNPKQLTDVHLRFARSIVNSDFPLSDIRGLTWVNATTVVVLAQDSSSETQPYEVSVDGSHVQPTAGFLQVVPVSVAAGPSSGAPLVIGANKAPNDGVLYKFISDQWTPLPTTVRLYAPAYPG